MKKQDSTGNSGASNKPDIDNQIINNQNPINRVFPVIIAVILVIIFYYFLLGMMEPSSFLPRLFIPAGSTLLTTSVPVLTLFFFLWSVFDMVFIFQHLKNENKILTANRKYLNAGQISSEDLKNIRSFWKGSVNSISFHRISHLIEIISTHKNIQSVYELFRYQTELETEKESSKYTLIKVAIWAMPILGFIGTVLGISMAVGNFSGFLTNDIEQIEAVKSELGKIATGLSFAFDTTLFGLLLSMIAMFISTFVQNFEQKHMSNLEETGYIIIDNAVIVDKTNSDSVHKALNIEDLLEKINSLFDHKILELTKTVDTFVMEFEKTSYSITNEFNRIPEKSASITSGLISQIEKSLGKISNDFADYSNKSTSMYNQELIDVLNEMKTTLNSLNPAIEALSKPTEIILTSSKKQL